MMRRCKSCHKSQAAEDQRVRREVARLIQVKREPRDSVSTKEEFLSEQAVERERQKREREKQIAESLKPEVKDTEIIHSRLPNVSQFFRQGKGAFSWDVK